MNLKIEWPANKGVDRRRLLVVLAFGVAAIWGGSYWLTQGEIVIRQGESKRRPAPVVTSAKSNEVTGRIAGDHLLFYPFCAAWIALGATMVTLTTAALVRGKSWLDILAFWSLAAVLPLGFLTVLTAILVKRG
jgi:hypothetical protein